MVSEYGYTDLATVEAYTGIDYSAIDSTAFTAVLIDAKISIAEKMVNGHNGVNGAISTITDGIKVATTVIAAILLDEALNVLGYHGEDERRIVASIGMNIHQVLEEFCCNTEVGVDAIPMNGANNDMW